MTIINEGAYWLHMNENILNPYCGEKMRLDLLKKL